MTPDAIVIGGGLAGLSAAAGLADAGQRVLVLEARPTLGGRATAFTDPATGERVDNGQHVLVGAYHETFRFLRRIGAAADVFLQPTLAVSIVDRDGRLSALVCPPLPPPLHLLGGILRWPALDWRDRLGALRLAAAIAAARVAPAPARGATVREWLVRHGQTARLVELLWEPLAVASLNQSIDEAAAAPFIVVLGRMFGWRRRDASLGLPVKPLDELYAAPARRFVEARRGEVRTGAPARVLIGDDGRSWRVRVREEELRAAALVCAVAWHALPALFPAPPDPLRPVVAAAAQTGASPIVTVNLWLDRPVTHGAFIGLPGRAMQWVFDKRALFGDAGSHLSLVASDAAALVGRGNEELVALAMRELCAALPAARAAAVRRAVVVREKRATFSVAPGQPARPGTATGVRGVYLAGDWIDTGLPATIESAVVSGHRAAAAVLADGRFRGA